MIDFRREYERHVGIWQCARCQRVVTQEFTMYMTHGIEGDMWCPCYSLLPAQGCVEMRIITKMAPMNAVAKELKRA